MTTEIKAAKSAANAEDVRSVIAGAIDVLERCQEYMKEHLLDNDLAHDEIREQIAALRRIEFVEVDDLRSACGKAACPLENYPCHCDPSVGAEYALDHLTTTGHAIVKMGE